jgi:predicted ATPase
MRRDHEACTAAEEELLALTGEHGFTFWSAHGEILLGWACAQAGDPPGGVELLNRGLSSWRATGAGLLVPAWSVFLADALLADARPAEAAAVLETGLALAVAQHQLLAAAELHRLRGRLALAEGRRDDAAAAFALALDMAHEKDERLLELRAGTSLAQLWADQDKRREARDLLAPIYGWFTEGFHLPDLQEARVLLDGLR